jgi:subtilisin family serine protease
LITGDVLYVTRSDTGHWAVAVKEASRPDGGVAFETFSDSQSDTYAVPADVVSLIPNMLDPYLFDLDYLTSNGLNDESMSVIGAFAQYAPGAALYDQWDNNTVQYSNFGIVNSQALSIPKDKAASFGSYLLSRPLSLPFGIEKIWLDKVATASLDQSVPMIGGDIARNVLGYNGSGINIAILDTGIDRTHPDFFYPNGTSKVIVYADETCKAVPVAPVCYHNPYDYFGHGTHVASIAAGTGAASNGRYVGVAPGARLMSIKVLNDQGFGFYSWIMYGLLQTVQGFFNGTKPDVISMSLGADPSDGSDPLSQLINLVVNTYNIPIAIAAGNFGCNFCVASPGAADSAITVAATTKTASNGSIFIASFSSRGPRQDNYAIKPDISAPGVGVVAACSSTATVIPCPPGSRYVRLSGTSMATPHVAGSIALLLQQSKQRGITLTPSEIKDMLQSSSNVLIPSLPTQPEIDIYQQGAGLVRVDKALTTNVTFDPAEISFGLVQVDTKSLQSTFNVTNHGPTAINLSLSWDMRDVRTQESPISTNSSYANLVSLDQTQLTIPAGASVALTLTINAPNAPTEKLYSIFSGRIFASIGNMIVAHAIFGFTKEGPRQTAQVTGINHDGTPAAFRTLSIYDALDGRGQTFFFVDFDSTGNVSVRLPLSSYNFIMAYDINPPFQSGHLSLYRVVALEVPVTNNPANVTLDASKTGPVTINLQADLSATHGLQQDDWLAYDRPDGTDIQFGFTLLGGKWTVYGVNTASAKIGTLIIFDRWLVSRSPEATSPVIYDLTMTSNIQQPTNHTVSDLSTLARTFASFHADVPGTEGVGRWEFSTAFNQFISVAGVGPIAAPSQRIEYQTPNEAIFNEIFAPDEGPSVFVLQSGFKTPYFGDFNYGRVYAPGETFYEDFAAQPVHPTLTLAVRQGNTLTLGGFEITDSFGHIGILINSRALRFTIRVYVNGVLNATGSQLWLAPISVTLPSTPATVEVQMTLLPDPSWSRLATSVMSDIVFRTRSELQGPISLPSYNYNVNGLNLSNTVPIDSSPTSLMIDVSTLAPTGAIINPANASALVSLDDGADWINASLVKLRSGAMMVSADIPTIGPGPFFVSLRMDVIVRPDITYSQTIMRAVKIGD